MDSTVLFWDNEGQRCPRAGATRFQEANLDQAVKFGLKMLYADLRDRIRSLPALPGPVLELKKDDEMIEVVEPVAEKWPVFFEKDHKVLDLSIDQVQ